jgi:zinc and cadmium transporter
VSSAILLLVYCVLILLASLAGGWIPLIVRLTHRRMEVALSFVSGVMLGVALLHLLPHAVMERSAAMAEFVEAVPHETAAVMPAETHDEADAHGHGHGSGTVGHDLLEPVVRWMVLGLLAMFLIERFFCYHHHDAPDGDDGSPGEVAAAAGHEHACGHDHGSHRHVLAWGGAAVGLTLHTLIAGVALAASVESGTHDGAAWAGLATFAVIVLHKPFDSLTIATLMAAGQRSLRSRHLVNALFSLAIPAGVLLFHLGLGRSDTVHVFVSGALAFSAGTFLCIALSDLLPELQFHRHDRLKLTLALLLGLALAWSLG